MRVCKRTNMKDTNGFKLLGIAILTANLAPAEHAKMARVTNVPRGGIVFQGGPNLVDGSTINGGN